MTKVAIFFSSPDIVHYQFFFYGQYCLKTVFGKFSTTNIEWFIKCKPIIFSADLREDKQFFMDHPGAVPITTAQVRSTINFLSPSPFLLLEGKLRVLHLEVTWILTLIFVVNLVEGRRIKKTNWCSCLHRV